MEWKIAYAHHEAVNGKSLCTIAEIEKSGFDIVPASVPGNLEIDLMKAGRLKDLYFSTNTLEAQKLEDVHVWYYTVLELTELKQYLHFEGIDTVADIYVNGKLVQSTENMFMSYDVMADWQQGANEVVVHIKPVMLEARKYTLPSMCYALPHNYASLYIRKAAHMYGWDIMPRIVSAGLWKEVSLRKGKTDEIKEVYMYTDSVNVAQNQAKVRFFVNTNLSGAFATDYTIRVEGTCGDSHYVKEEKLWHITHAFYVYVEDCKFWWPRNAGQPNLYDTTVTLLKNGEVCDVYRFKQGIRTVELDRTDITDENANGEFCFKVNGKKIFAMGTNWVPLDALHSNDRNRLPKALELLYDIGCNIVRCWGGNVYESDEFYEFCDEHGIMVWQDFSMGCAEYPDEEAFRGKLEEEAIFQIKRLRNHASLILWAGDNECDAFAISGKGTPLRNPNHSRPTRQVLREAVEVHDLARPYLPSSPYVSEAAFLKKGLLPEEHLWGPRDYFKGNYYKNTFTHFASEMGYHGFNSPESLKRFLKEPEKIFEENGNPTDEYLIHAASPEASMKSPYAYRIRLAYNHVVTLFGKAEETLEDFTRQSQISQAEAKKYFIEKFRIAKWNRTGIIWWNLLDGWPQVSDAVVDYYFIKKLAYHYIKRSQEPVCLMFDEPENGKIALIGANDLPEDKIVKYTVKRISVVESNETEDTLALYGQAHLNADQTMQIDLLPIAEDEKEFYLIEWEMDGQKYRNHYFTNIIDIDYRKYMAALKKCGMDEFEGFEA